MAFGFSFSHKTKDIKNLWENFGNTATDEFNAGNALTSEGLGQLRGQYGNYESRLSDPLGSVGRGIFTRARGMLTDQATQSTGAFGARLSQISAQTGGNLSPEAQAQLREQNQRDVNQKLFEGNVSLSNQEAGLTLEEVSKLFDRMDKISSTFLGVGKDRSSQGLMALVQSILGRQNLKQSNVSNALAAVGTAMGAAKLAAGGAGGGGGSNPYTGG